MDLKLLAEKVSEVYAQNSKIEAVLLGGSVSRNGMMSILISSCSYFGKNRRLMRTERIRFRL